MNAIQTKTGRLSDYGLRCGHVEKIDLHSKYRVTLSEQHGIFHIKGFCNGEHFWDVAERITAGRRKFDWWKRRITEQYNSQFKPESSDSPN